jgi:Fic-DOC domain mobile mystery protein B
LPLEPIEGETPIDPSDLKIRGITSRSELSLFEMESIRKAEIKYLSSKPSRRTAKFDFAWCLRLHEEMFGEVWKWAGKIRAIDLNIGSPPCSIVCDLENLIRDLHTWSGFGMGMLEQGVQLHHRAVRIHPFLNGSGRWSRLLSNIWLRRHDHAPTNWPEKVIGNESEVRVEYMDAIRAADMGDYEPLTALHRRFCGQQGANSG